MSRSRMHLLIAAGALMLLATPAFAQRLDTRRVNIRETPTTTACDFNAYPMMLIDGTKSGVGKVVSWRSPPDDAKPDDRNRFEFIFEPVERGRARVIGIGVTLYPDDLVTRETVGRANIRLDQMPITTSYNAMGDKMIFAAVRDLDGLGEKLAKTSTLELQVLNPEGRAIRSYYWNVERLGEGLETGSVVKWACVSPPHRH